MSAPVQTITVSFLGTLTKPRFSGFVILSEAKNLSLYRPIETLRFAQGDMEEVLLEPLTKFKFFSINQH